MTKRQYLPRYVREVIEALNRTEGEWFWRRFGRERAITDGSLFVEWGPDRGSRHYRWAGETTWTRLPAESTVESIVALARERRPS